MDRDSRVALPHAFPPRWIKGTRYPTRITVPARVRCGALVIYEAAFRRDGVTARGPSGALQGVGPGPSAKHVSLYPHASGRTEDADGELGAVAAAHVDRAGRRRAERREGELALRRGFGLAPGERVLVVEDVVTTGQSTRETIEVAGHSGGEVVGAAAVINRGGSALTLGVQFEALAEVSWPTHDPQACPLCDGCVPLTKPGSRPGRGA